MDEKSDIYSLGVVLWEISSHRAPFLKEDCVHLSFKIIQGLRENPVKGTPMEYIEIYTECWQSEPVYRPLISLILTKLQSLSLEPVFEDSDNKDNKDNKDVSVSSVEEINTSGNIIKLVHLFFLLVI
ncbi:hypothetical protein C1645_768736 [Glomus cerebriforme]|uniref:Protein kinase domain-containing protein n=1 Tax=Glomus cerebriforme TaxID=658196 RepID=A0A397T0L5_9GLOM|nr:hypothetical protein C1645_768736 [Glomus cerebriforme]